MSDPYITGSQHDPVTGVDDPDTYSMALLWANAYDSETQRLQAEVNQQAQQIIETIEERG